jgi:phosphoribosyl 1,2-cyclic phosphodiesterase
MIHSSSVRRHADIIGKIAFFELEITAEPNKGFPPLITKAPIHFTSYKYVTIGIESFRPYNEVPMLLL